MTTPNAPRNAGPNGDRSDRNDRLGRRPFGVGRRRLSQKWLALSAASVALAAALPAVGVAQAASADTETLVFIRHGEKPAKGYGQLDCQGLNRALALPAVIAAKFGKPDALYAPNPSIRKKDGGVPYDYVRPLATIEPTAIQFALPVDTTYGFSQIDALEQALVKPEHSGKLIVAAWEHHQIQDLVQDIVNRYGDAGQTVQPWRNDDFDSMYVVKLEWNGLEHAPHASFAIDREGLNDRSRDCPCAALPDAPASAASGR